MTPVAKRIVSEFSWDRAVVDPEFGLPRIHTERTQRVSYLFEQAKAVWGLGNAREFVLSYQARLDGAPLDLAAESTAGAGRAEELLVRIDHGLAV